MSKILEELAQEAESKILQAIENGVAPWLKPWSNNGLLPHNPYTGTIYQGINALRLMCDSYSELVSTRTKTRTRNKNKQKQKPSKTRARKLNRKKYVREER